MPLNPGDALNNDHYRIIRQLGRGGFGFVYLAQDTLLGEQVAIKELIPALVGDEATLKRFLTEARATMRLRHKRIVATHNVFQEGGNYYIVMEYMAGGSLEERLRAGGSLPVDEAVRVAAEVCEGLACAHEEQVVHCDLKPANILFDANGHAKVADFGIAHVSGEMLTRSWMTPAGFVAGTLPYMSPEQADGVRDDPRIDVYAVGAVLYRMLVGRPYLEFDPRETPGAQADNVLRIRSEPPSSLRGFNRGIPATLDQVVLRALAKRPEERHADIKAMGAALRQREVTFVPAVSPPSLPSTKMSSPRQRVGAAPPRERPAPGRPAVSAAPVAKRASSLPVWFWPVVGAAAVLIVFLVIAVAALTRGGDGAPVVELETPTGGRPAETLMATQVATHTPKLEAPEAGTTQTRSKDSMIMVYVPTGEFTMGSDDSDSDAGDDEKPQHTVSLDGFWIDRTEVTNAQYRQCVEAGACTPPSTKASDSLSNYYGNKSYDDYPVIYVGWSEAKTYCEWAGVRLPTEAEWEKAARGTDGRKYPWGNSAPDCACAQYAGCGEGTMPVESKSAGESPYGALGMAGNVWEWVSDWYDGGYYSDSPTNNPKGPNSGDCRALRGGSWRDPWNSVRATNRYFNLYPMDRRDDVGFRCASAGSPGE